MLAVLGKRLRCTIEAHASLVASVAFAPDGGLLATASQDGSVRLWEAASSCSCRDPVCPRR
jgi:WD40 repeat protein